MTEPTDDEHDLELVMPFVTVHSAGGPHDDDAYAAGWEMSTLDHDLASGDIVAVERAIRTASLPQADLLAMRHGYAMTAVEHDDTWTLATFSYDPQEQP